MSKIKYRTLEVRKGSVFDVDPANIRIGLYEDKSIWLDEFIKLCNFFGINNYRKSVIMNEHRVIVSRHTYYLQENSNIERYQKSCEFISVDDFIKSDIANDLKLNKIHTHISKTVISLL